MLVTQLNYACTVSYRKLGGGLTRLPDTCNPTMKFTISLLSQIVAQVLIRSVGYNIQLYVHQSHTQRKLSTSHGEECLVVWFEILVTKTILI